MKGDNFIELGEAIEHTLYLSKYFRNQDKKYKKYKKRVKKVLKAYHKGELGKYLREEESDE